MAQKPKPEKAKHQKKKNPYLVVMRYHDWPEGQYQVLPSEVFPHTQAASAARDAVLEANQVDVGKIVREHGGLRVGVACFTDLHDIKPTLGYAETPVDSMTAVPLPPDKALVVAEAPQAAAVVEIGSEEASEPPKKEEPAEEPVVAPEASPPPAPPVPPAAPPAAPPPETSAGTSSDQPPASQTVPSEEAPAPDLWADIDQPPLTEEPPVAEPQTTEPAPAADGGVTDDFLV